jgi:hypothetical protein
MSKNQYATLAATTEHISGTEIIRQILIVSGLNTDWTTALSFPRRNISPMPYVIHTFHYLSPHEIRVHFPSSLSGP